MLGREACLRHRFARGGKRQNGHAVLQARLGRGHHRRHVLSRDEGGMADLLARQLLETDRADGARPLARGAPKRIYAHAGATDGAHACYDDPVHGFAAADAFLIRLETTFTRSPTVAASVSSLSTEM